MTLSSPNKIHQARADGVALIGDKTVEAKIIAGFKPQAQMERFLFLIFVIHALQEIGNPADARFAEDKAKTGIAVKSAGIDNRGEKLRRTKTRYRLLNGVTDFRVLFEMRVIGVERRGRLAPDCETRSGCRSHRRPPTPDPNRDPKSAARNPKLSVPLP